MNPMLALCLAAILYIAYAWLSFGPHKSATWMIPAALTIVLAANVLWLMLARSSTTERLFLYGIVWDVLVTAATVGVPILLFGVRLSATGWLGAGLGLVGLGILKLS